MARGRALDEPDDYVRALRRVGITRREAEIAHLISWQHKNREIAAILSIAEPTVKTHVRAVFAKLRKHDRHDVGSRVRLELRKWRRRRGAATDTP